MTLYANEVNRQLAQAKYRAMLQQAETERLPTPTPSHKRGRRLGRSLLRRLGGLVAALGTRGRPRAVDTRGEQAWTSADS